MKFQIVCDSSVDLPQSYLDQNNISVVPFYVSLDGQKYVKEGVDITVHAFYQAMVDRSDCFPKTSMPTIPDYLDTMLPLAQSGTPILCLCLTQKFSGSYQSALNARQAILADCEGARVHVMDSQLVTALEGLLLQEAVRLRDLDLELEEAVPLLEAIRSTGHIFFTTKDLKYLQRGGRLGKVASIAGSMLDLKPLLHFHDGELDTTQICRGRKKSLQRVMDSFLRYVEENHIDLSGYLFSTGIGLDVPEYEPFLQELQQRMEEKGIHPAHWSKAQIGATIGVHTGPYPLGLGFLKKCDI